jgi:hypothetical protein
MVAPWHTTVELAVIAPGFGLTVITAVVTQPLTAYDTVTVPATPAVTVPPLDIVAMADGVPLAGVPIDQVPPPVVEVRRLVAPLQSASVPVIGFGGALTVISVVTIQPPGKV